MRLELTLESVDNGWMMRSNWLGLPNAPMYPPPSTLAFEGENNCLGRAIDAAYAELLQLPAAVAK